MTGLALLLAFGTLPLVAQGAGRMPANGDFHKDPGGTPLGTISKNAAVVFGQTRAGWREVTLVGWIETKAVRPDTRDGFDVSVTSDNTPIRTEPDAAAPIRAVARTGALFDRVSTRGGWSEIRRTAWTPVSTAAPESPAPTPAPSPAQAGTTPGPTATDSTQVAVQGGTQFSADAGGPPIGTLEATRRATVTERRAGWSRVTLDVWVRDGSVGGAPSATGITGKDVRDEPDRYIGQTVEWSLQVLAVQQADELRPELPLGQPYVLARGPLPETGFVYLLLPTKDVAAWRALGPLAEVRVRATIRAGRTRYLPTPVIELVRRLD
ncbi:MAG TPA: hypothetical protein VFN22_02040 [Gemmatimonadales bacterium]|nr:hypothetical protein [Gemmatimonadales bacterium]